MPGTPTFPAGNPLPFIGLSTGPARKERGDHA
jgi:hypothetical protein